MQLRKLGYLLIIIAFPLLLSLFVVVRAFQPDSPIHRFTTTAIAHARPALTVADAPQVVVGTPQLAVATPLPPRYTYRNEFPVDRSQPLPLYVIDTQTGQETRLGNGSGAGVFSAQSEQYLLWHFICGTDCSGLIQGLYAYVFATQENRFISAASSSIIHPQIAGEWVAFGESKPRSPSATLYAANLQTREIITLTQELNAQVSAGNGHFGISARLATWYTFSYPEPSAIVIYDLTQHAVVASLTAFQTAFNERNMPITSLMAGETIVTWTSNYGYDLVTDSYFRKPTSYPPDWDGKLVSGMTPIVEKDRVLSWVFTMQDGTQRYIQAPLLDATPSTSPCIPGENLVRNGSFESVVEQDVWQQSGSATNLLVNDAPPGLVDGGAWAVRLGRTNNGTPSIQQALAIPSGVGGITLTLAVRVHSWELWGGDQLQVDLVDPLTGESILATPVAWTNAQLASGDWIPLQVAIENWSGLDTPLTLILRAQTDWAFPTDFTIDNIAFTTSCQ